MERGERREERGEGRGETEERREERRGEERSGERSGDAEELTLETTVRSRRAPMFSTVVLTCAASFAISATASSVKLSSTPSVSKS